jgi:hypothetical protein
VLRQHAVAPIADAPDDLHTARPMRRTRIVSVIGIIFYLVSLQTMETLLEVATDLLPFLTMRMAYDRLVWGNVDIVGKREPVIAT